MDNCIFALPVLMRTLVHYYLVNKVLIRKVKLSIELRSYEKLPAGIRYWGHLNIFLRIQIIPKITSCPFCISDQIIILLVIGCR